VPFKSMLIRSTYPRLLRLFYKLTYKCILISNWLIFRWFLQVYVNVLCLKVYIRKSVKLIGRLKTFTP
jgi:hypothetical protein